MRQNCEGRGGEGRGERGRDGLPRPYALCPMPHALCPMPHSRHL
ncbi:MAG TPA: histidine kinase [Microcoleaceae bacterium UBA10368]|nr:histidine kinase [Microcoleaceae cyanobacterium UBA11344]HBK97689.1 histidine kinase [Microcoleaceae cyanobacterium UBA10368]HCV31725.1 histidine kinase [Microcoleaceae cyanobacterium UBA9251]